MYGILGLWEFDFKKFIGIWIKSVKFITINYNAWEVCEGKVIISKLNCYAYFFTSKVVCDHIFVG